MSSFGGRLRQACERWGSIRGFQQEMEKRLADTDVDGYSYPSINAYLNDRVSPRVEFVEHAADVLGVRKAWLATGDGEMTEEEEIAAEMMEKAHATSESVVQAGTLPGSWDLPVPLGAPAKYNLLGAWSALIEAHGGELGEEVEGTGLSLASYTWKKLQNAAVAPLVDLPSYVEPSEGRAFNDFVAAEALAISRYVHAASVQPDQREQEEENNGSE